jgi:hypothetical protein
MLTSGLSGSTRQKASAAHLLETRNAMLAMRDLGPIDECHHYLTLRTGAANQWAQSLRVEEALAAPDRREAPATGQYWSGGNYTVLNATQSHALREAASGGLSQPPQHWTRVG